MKKWLIVLGALAALALLTAPLVLAKGKPDAGKAKGATKFECEATVVSASSGGVLTVAVKSGSKTITAYVKAYGTGTPKAITVQIDPKAKLIDATVDPSVPLTLDKLVKGAKVHLGGSITAGATGPPVVTATKVILQKPPTS